ncbi:MAG TPA: TetR/AcrR family transcriptional regulator [Gemmatimonadaceae bacterium]|nr:TetR/AcrR family transcriptional regulator [Gemmatimonadaceae bacterium]
MERSSGFKGRDRQKARTRRALLEAAGRLLGTGATPSVAEVADAAEVSRRTAYRYFPTQEQMLTEAVLESLRPTNEQALEREGIPDQDDDPEERLDRAVRVIQRAAVENEAMLRTMVRLTVAAPAGSTDSTPSGVRRRGYRRIEWIELALEPVKKQLSRRRFDRLVNALTVSIGIESLIVLRDLNGLSPEEAESVSRWMARTLLRASLKKAKGGS